MNQRLSHVAASPEPLKTMLALEKTFAAAAERALRHLIKLRASQINGCAHRIDMHWKDARGGGHRAARRESTPLS